MGIGAAIGGASSLISGLFGAHAANSAAQVQANSAQQGIDLQKQIFAQQQANQQPFINAGDQSLGTLMQALQSGKFGSGSTGTAPTFQGGTFSAPSLEDARNTPGYQFTAQQGSKGILQGAAAAGGAISGGTLKALAGYNTGLADNTYNDVFNRSLSTYNAGLSKYQADLQGYGAKLAGNQQEYNQLFAPAQLGENAVAGINNTGTQMGANISSLLGQQGNAQAAGIVGSTNQLTGGITGGLNSLSQGLTLGQLLPILRNGSGSTGVRPPTTGGYYPAAGDLAGGGPG